MVLPELRWETMTSTANNIEKPNSFWRKLIFNGARDETLFTEIASLHTWEGARKVAPFVKKNAQAIMVDGPYQTERSVETPNIKIKHPFEPSHLLDDRAIGTRVFPSKGEINKRRREYVKKHLEYMDMLVEEAIEWMCSQLIDTGTIAYEVADADAWTISMPKPAANTYTSSNLWSTASNNPGIDFKAAKKLMQPYGMQPTICVMGSDAATGFINNEKVQAQLEARNIIAGELDLTQMYRDTGAIYLGMYQGIPCFEYSGTTDLNGSSVDAIGAKKAHFIHVGPKLQAKMFYGAIADWDAFKSGSWVGKRFSKSWVEQEPSVMWALLQTRPLPWIERPGGIVTVTAVA